MRIPEDHAYSWVSTADCDVGIVLRKILGSSQGICAALLKTLTCATDPISNGNKYVCSREDY